MGIFPNLQYLLLAQPRKAEHPNLLRNVLPTPLLPIQFLKLPPQRFAHVYDSATHGAEIGFPFFEELWIVEDETGDAGAVGRRVADFTALENSELRCDPPNGFFGVGAGASDEMESSRSFTVKTEVFGKGLRDTEFKSLCNEITDGPCVVFEISRGETLVCAVEEWEVGFGADDFGDVGPLVMGEVDAGGVVGAGVEEDDAAFGG